jgi:hypothetical protein
VVFPEELLNEAPPIVNDQRYGNGENGNPVAPNPTQFGPQKRIRPRHASAPGMQGDARRDQDLNIGRDPPRTILVTPLSLPSFSSRNIWYDNYHF